MTDARRLHSGSYSGWLVKSKSAHAMGRWLVPSTTRLFTIDYDSQVFYYSRGETKAGSKLKTSVPIGFGDIQGATMCPTQTSQGFSFTLKAVGHEFNLFAATEWDAELWVVAFLGARDK